MNTTDNDKVLAVLGYFGLLFLIPLFAGKSEFTKYHANQGLVLFLMQVIVGGVAGVISIIPFVGWIIGGIASVALSIVTLILIIKGVVTAVNLEMKPLPLIGNIQILK